MKKSIIVVFLNLLLLFFLSSCFSSKEFSVLKKLGDVEIINLPKGIGNMEVVSCKGIKQKEETLKIVSSIVSKNKLTLLVEASERDENVIIYGTLAEKGDKIKNALIVCEEGEELSVVRMKGTVDLKDLHN